MNSIMIMLGLKPVRVDSESRKYNGRAAAVALSGVHFGSKAILKLTGLYYGLRPFARNQRCASFHKNM